MSDWKWSLSSYPSHTNSLHHPSQSCKPRGKKSTLASLIWGLGTSGFSFWLYLKHQQQVWEAVIVNKVEVGGRILTLFFNDCHAVIKAVVAKPVISVLILSRPRVSVASMRSVTDVLRISDEQITATVTATWSREKCHCLQQGVGI